MKTRSAGLTTAELKAGDAAHHLHPFTNARALNENGARVISSAKGVYIYDTDGNKILDGMSGLWCVSVGHGRKDIVNAVARQLDELTFSNTLLQHLAPAGD